MLDLSSFAPAQALPSNVGEGFPRDADGLLIPPNWQGDGGPRRRWDTLALPVRQKWSREFEEALALVRNAPPPKPKRERQGPAATRFTTDSAVSWGRRQGWKLVDRERYDFRMKRHYDLELGVDAMFDNPKGGRIGVQGAGKGEKAEHLRRFNERGGIEKARRRGVRVIYLEFERGNPNPVLQEEWA